MSQDCQVMDVLRAVVAENPEYIYSIPKHYNTDEMEGTCFYVHSNVSGGLERPGCLIGNVGERIGLSLAQMAKYEGSSALQMLSKLMPGLSLNTLRILDDVQDKQDNGYTWKDAYETSVGKLV